MVRADQLKIRPMTGEDLSAVVALEQQVQYAPWSRQLFVDGLERGHECRVVADEAGCIHGFSVVQYILDEVHLLNIAVSPESQGGGVGRMLLEALLHEAAARQAATVFLEVRSGNERAIRLYQQAGFNEIGLRKNYYPSPGGGKEHAVMMALVP